MISAPGGAPGIDSSIHQRLWPWQEQPYKLWSLLEMLRLFAAPFLFQSKQLARLAQILRLAEIGHLPNDTIPLLEETLKAIEDELKNIPLSPLIQDRISRLRRAANNGETPDRLGVIADELGEDIETDLDQWAFFAVDPKDRSFYKAPEEYFGEGTFKTFPDSAYDLKAAARCFALDEWTACVFHLMRAIESGPLHAWAVQLGASLSFPVTEAGWGELLRAGENKIKELQNQPRTPERTADQEFYGKTMRALREINLAWRQIVSHSKKTYDAREALDAMNAVEVFMRKLAVGP